MTRRPKPRRTGPTLNEVGRRLTPLEEMQRTIADGGLFDEETGTVRPHRRHAGPLPAREIREALAGGATDAELAARYGCSLSAISRIATGAVHRDAGGPIRTERRGKLVARTVTLPRELSERVDRARGEEEFTEWMRGAAEMRLQRRRGSQGQDPPS